KPPRAGPGRSTFLRPLPFSEDNDAVGFLGGEGFGAAVRPEDLDRVHALDLPQAEVGAWVVAAQVAVGRVDAADPLAFAGANGDDGPVGVAPPPGRDDGADQQPAAAPGDDVVIDPRLLLDVRHHQVEGAVA